MLTLLSVWVRRGGVTSDAADALDKQSQERIEQLSTAFTLFFYGLGWYVRARMRLRNSGIALVATGSLLVPVDFYDIYLSGGIFPRQAWAEVWLIASAVCLVAYTITAMTLRVAGRLTSPAWRWRSIGGWRTPSTASPPPGIRDARGPRRPVPPLLWRSI